MTSSSPRDDARERRQDVETQQAGTGAKRKAPRELLGRAVARFLQAEAAAALPHALGEGRAGREKEARGEKKKGSALHRLSPMRSPKASTSGASFVRFRRSCQSDAASSLRLAATSTSIRCSATSTSN